MSYHAEYMFTLCRIVWVTSLQQV
uniref:Uncharacterized protein n=1 Tax=Anguilla anguilla TaxID=7936 RepID=A0A0E9XWB3_ANGAN